MRFRWPAILAIPAVAGIISAAAQIPFYSVKTEEVRLDVLVSDDGKPVKGLRAADFEVFDNEVRQTIESVSFQQVPISATLVLDMSRSVSGPLADRLKSAGRDILNRLVQDERAALIAFSHSVILESPLTADLDGVKAALDRSRPHAFGRTSLRDAAYAGLIHAESKADRPLLIVFSDGLDITSWLTDAAVLEAAKLSDTVVYAVSAGRVPDVRFLRDLSEITGGSFFQVESTNDLSAVFLGILDEFRQRYLLSYSPRGISKSRWHDLKVRVKRRGVDVKHRPGYLVDSMTSLPE